jgi:hypothetical protein
MQQVGRARQVQMLADYDERLQLMQFHAGCR